MQQETDPANVENFAYSLKEAREEGTLGEEMFLVLEAELKAEDANGRAWRPRLEDNAWERLQGEDWVRQDHPPEVLFMNTNAMLAFEVLLDMHFRTSGLRIPTSSDSAPEVIELEEFLAALEKAEAGPSGSRAPAPRAPERNRVGRIRVEAMARALRAAQHAGAMPAEHFQHLHASFSGRDDRGLTWTVALQSGEWNCLQEGGWKPGQPPEALEMDPEVVSVIERLPQPQPDTVTPSVTPKPSPRAELQTCPNPACQAQVLKESAFCPHCGQSMTGPPQEPPPPERRTCPNPNCGKPVQPGRNFCTSCGTRLD